MSIYAKNDKNAMMMMMAVVVVVVMMIIIMMMMMMVVVMAINCSYSETNEGERIGPNRVSSGGRVSSC
jgi:hypothetical protein